MQIVENFKKTFKRNCAFICISIERYSANVRGNKKKNESPRTGDMTEEKEAELKPVFEE